MRSLLSGVWLVLACGSALAQPAGQGEPDDAPPGAYASPSAIPEGTADERFGIPRTEGRVTMNPVPLPEGFGQEGGLSLAIPVLPAFAPQLLPDRNLVRPEHALVLDARLDEDGAPIPDGLVWRLFSPNLNRDGQLQIIQVVKGGQAVFDVPAGSYILHVGYGRAGITKRIEFTGAQTSETITLEAGGLRLSALASTASAQPIVSEKLTFDIYRPEGADHDRRLIAGNVPADVVLRLNAGDYQVVSNYGGVNAVARADVRVEAGRITSARLQHRAAEMTLKLVREEGGEAIADTSWSIASAQGDIVRESVGAFASMVLAEGDYVVVAKNRDRIYERDITVQAGENGEVQLLLAESVDGAATGGSGD